MAKDQDTTQGVNKGDHNPMLHSLLEEAQRLDTTKQALYADIGNNRDACRMLARTGFASAEQAKAVAEFYPVKQTKKAAAAS